MCGILVYSKAYDEYFGEERKDTKQADYYLKKRGPDATNELSLGDLRFRHYHLKISRNAKTQPFINENYISLFNGEIYNGMYLDGDNIIPQYEENGLLYTNELDGEFAIVIYDIRRKQMVISTDPFGTKPLYFNSDSSKGIIISSYESVIKHIGKKPRRVAANTTIVIDIDCQTVKKIIHPHVWMPNKKQTTLDDWSNIFEEAMRKRIYTTDRSIFFGLSGGYDSGVISCFLSKENRNKAITAISVLNTAEAATQMERIRHFEKKEILTWSEKTEQDSVDYATKNIEDLRCIEYSTGTGYYSDKPMIEDSGFKKLIYVANKASKTGQKIFIDGMGGDEIYSDYGWNGKRLGIHSNFGGKYPENMVDIVPKNPYNKREKWASFYNSTMSTYLSKSEHVIGSFGQESRYPLLDKSLVSCFLSLPMEKKNKHYKSPLYYYMKESDWPIMENQKHGF